jgi:hypothetical protein
MADQKTPEEKPSCNCPVCQELGKQETLKEVTGLIDIAPNPQAAKGIPRVVDCTAGCRFDLEPYFNPKSNGTYCYMLIRSERNPEAVVNHYWFHPSCIQKTK